MSDGESYLFTIKLKNNLVLKNLFSWETGDSCWNNSKLGIRDILDYQHGTNVPHQILNFPRFAGWKSTEDTGGTTGGGTLGEVVLEEVHWRYYSCCCISIVSAILLSLISLLFFFILRLESRALSFDYSVLCCMSQPLTLQKPLVLLKHLIQFLLWKLRLAKQYCLID